MVVMADSFPELSESDLNIKTGTVMEQEIIEHGYLLAADKSR